MKRIFIYLSLFLFLFFTISTVWEKWDYYLLQGFSYVYQVKEKIFPSSSVQTTKPNYSLKNEENTSTKLSPSIPTYEIAINSDTLNIVGIGDSLTKGIGSSDKRGYFSYLEKEWKSKFLNINISNYAIKGRKSYQVLEDLEKEKVRYSIEQADLVFLSVGGNDIMKVVQKEMFNVTLEKIEEQRTPFRDNLKKIIQTIHQINSDAHVIIIGLYNPFTVWVSSTPEPFKALDTWNSEYQKLDDTYEFVYYIPIKQVFAEDTKSLLYKDRFHPNDEGYKKIGLTILKQIQLQNKKES